MVTTNNLPFAPPGRAGLPGDADFTGIPGSPISTIDCRGVHVAPGRVRLRVPQLKTSAGFARNLILQLERQAGIKAVRVNAACAALVVTFESSRTGAAEIVACVSGTAPADSQLRHIVHGRSPHLPSKTALIAGAGTFAVLSQVAPFGAAHLLDDAHPFVRASDVLDLALSAMRGELRVALISIVFTVLARYAGSAFLRWLRRNERMKEADQQPLLSVVRPTAYATRGFACAA